jgi:acetyl esterase/lipase
MKSESRNPKPEAGGCGTEPSAKSWRKEERRTAAQLGSGAGALAGNSLAGTPARRTERQPRRLPDYGSRGGCPTIRRISAFFASLRFNRPVPSERRPAALSDFGFWTSFGFRISVFGFLLLLAASLSSLALAAAPFSIERDVAFLPADRQEKADLYLPAATESSQRRPAVVIIHGGGWNSGDKGAGREINIGTNLALNGYVGMSINYVLSTNGKVTWPQNLHDCKTAVRWLRANAARLQVDPDRIGTIGGSAGGQLAAMLAVTGPADKLDPAGPYGEFSCAVKCAVDLYGPADLMEYHDVRMLGKTRAEAPELYRAASPTSYADAGDAPILILHATADKTVDLKQSELLAVALKKAGTKHEFVIVEGAPHTFHLQPKQRDLRPLVLGFLDRYLKPAAAPGDKAARP